VKPAPSRPSPPDAQAWLGQQNPFVRGLVEPFVLSMVDAMEGLRNEVSVQKAQTDDLLAQMAVQRAQTDALLVQFATQRAQTDALLVEIAAQRTENDALLAQAATRRQRVVDLENELAAARAGAGGTRGDVPVKDSDASDGSSAVDASAVSPVVAALQAKLSDLEEQQAVRDHRIKQLERQLYGRKSERRKVSDVRRAARKARRQKLTEEEREAKRQAEREKNRNKLKALPSVTREIPLPAGTCCPACGGTELHPLPDGERSVQYEWVPGRLQKIEFVREKSACSCGKGIVTAPPPPQVKEGGKYGPALHAHTVVSKCMDAMPLHRQSRAMARLGVPLAPSQLCAMFHRTAEVVRPVYNAMVALLPESYYVQADETTQPVLAEGQVRKGWMWTFLDTLSIVFVFDPSRGGKVPLRVLGQSAGVLTVDGHTGYNSVSTPLGRDRAGCWSHARRKLFEAKEYAPDVIDGVLDDILELFVVEQEAIEEDYVGGRRHLRRRKHRSVKVLARIFATLDTEVVKFSPKSAIAKAMRYTLNQREELSLFLTDAKIPIHNNASESALRIVALLRKNALFVGHDEGGQNLAVLMTMCATCHLHGVNPERWFTDVLIRVSERGSNIEELLPWRWAQGRGAVADTS